MRRSWLQQYRSRNLTSLVRGTQHPAPLSALRSAFRFQDVCNRRALFTQVPSILVPPVIFGGLFVGLWTWKCLMMVLFQNKIIYMPGLPPNARREKISDYTDECQGITWREERTKSSDGTEIALCLAEVESQGPAKASAALPIYIVYFQGNASSLPPRLPLLSPVLRSLKDESAAERVRYVMVCVSYRGYWTSNGRATEAGIAMDAAAALKWISGQESVKGGRLPVIIWGQSIGAGVATTCAAKPENFAWNIDLRMLILETPFLSIKEMLVTLYPQKWLPYRYLWPFLRNHLDSWKALGQIAMRSDAPSVIILQAGRDELVPKSHGDTLEKRCQQLGIEVQKYEVSGAYHPEVMIRPQGPSAVLKAIRMARSSLATRR